MPLAQQRPAAAFLLHALSAKCIMNMFIKSEGEGMPKRIDDLQASLLAAAKTALLERGYRSLTIRGVANSCGVAVGTVYNYFPSKDVLAARVMLEDWEKALEDMRRECGAAQTAKEGLRAMFGAIRGFSALYRGAWRESGVRTRGNERYDAYRGKLRGQIAEIAGTLLARFGLTGDAYLPAFTAEMLLTLAADEGFDFNRLDQIIQKLYS